MLVVVGDEADFLAVGREVVGDAAAQHEDERVAAGSQVLVGLGLRVEEDEMVAAAVAVARPVAVEQFVGDMRLHGTLLLLLHTGLVGLGVGSEVGINLGGEGDIAAVGRHHRVVDAQFIVGQLLALAGSQVHTENLCRTILIIGITDTLAVLAPHGRAALAVLGEGTHVGAVCVHHVDV